MDRRHGKVLILADLRIVTAFSKHRVPSRFAPTGSETPPTARAPRLPECDPPAPTLPGRPSSRGALGSHLWEGDEQPHGAAGHAQRAVSLAGQSPVLASALTALSSRGAGGRDCPPSPLLRAPSVLTAHCCRGPGLPLSLAVTPGVVSHSPTSPGAVCSPHRVVLSFATNVSSKAPSPVTNEQC